MGDRIYVADKETLDQVHAVIVGEPVYGFIEHMNIKSPTERITALGLNRNYTNVVRDASTGALNLNDWANFPVVKANKPYMVKKDGTPDYMLCETNYALKADGVTASDVSNADYEGGAFSWFPRIYKHEHMEGNDRVVMFSMTERDGYEAVGFKDSENNVLDGVWLPMFYGTIIDGTMKCISGNQPAYNNTTAAEHTAIQAFGERARFLGGPIVETIIDILIMMAGTTNLQAAYGRGNCSGYDESLAPTYGVKQNAVIGGGQFYGTDDGKSLNKIFHSIVLGSYQQYMRDPYELVVNGRVKVSKNYTYDVTGETYEDTGINVPNGPAAWEYPLRYQTVEGYGSVPAIEFAGGSTSTGGCDGLYRSASQETMTAVALRFARCDRGLLCGPRARYWGGTAGGAYWDHGAAVLLLPPVGVAA